MLQNSSTVARGANPSPLTVISVPGVPYMGLVVRVGLLAALAWPPLVIKSVKSISPRTIPNFTLKEKAYQPLKKGRYVVLLLLSQEETDDSS